MKRKHKQLYQQLVDAHADDVYRYYARWGFTRVEIEDLSQEAYTEAWKSIATYRSEASLKVWLLTICRRLAWKWVQKRNRSEQASQVAHLEEASEDGILHLETRSHLRSIARHLPRLSEAHQEVLFLHYLHELSESEIASFLDIPKGTVHSRLRTARQQLRIYCQEA